MKNIIEKLTDEAEKLFEVTCTIEESEVKDTIIESEHNIREIIDELTDRDKKISVMLKETLERIEKLSI